MKMVKHPNIVTVKDCFYSHAETGRDVYLNLVMEFIQETVYQTIRTHARAHQTIPYIYIKCYSYQICRAVSYCHTLGICHRDIKPQNLLLDPQTHTVKLCDFGSAKLLVSGEPNVAYICSRYYRAPELIFESSNYTTTIDIWSLGCVIAELFLGTPLFQGGSGVDQLVEIIKVLGAPTKEEILAMNKNYTQFKFPQVKPLAWTMVFRSIAYKGQPVPDEGIDLIKNLLVFHPEERTKPFAALRHAFFDELRNPDSNSEITQQKSSAGVSITLPELFNFTEAELQRADALGGRESFLPSGAQGDEEKAA